jgi:uncharacterized protein YndB with AHSA1/START domain
MNDNIQTLTKTIMIAADRKTVWAYLTQSDKLAIWFHGPTANLAKGKDFNMMSKKEPGKTLCWGEVLEWDEPKRLVYTFSLHMMEKLVTNVAWQLEEVSGGTRVTMVHTGLPAGKETVGLTFGLDEGWDKHFASLRECFKAA